MITTFPLVEQVLREDWQSSRADEGYTTYETFDSCPTSLIGWAIFSRVRKSQALDRAPFGDRLPTVL
jgi:hypothetical protein